MSGAIVITLYLVFFATIVIVTNRDYRISYARGGISPRRRTALKMPYGKIAIFTAMFLVIDIVCTYGKEIGDLGGDRKNFYLMFIGLGGDALTYGLARIFDFVRLYSNDIRSAFYLTSVVCFALLFTAYKISDDATPRALAFLLLTDIAFVFYVNLKQAYAVALAYLMFAIALKKRSLRRDLLCAALIALACVFHPSAMILIFAFVLIRLFPRIDRIGTKILFYIVALLMIAMLLLGQTVIAYIAGIVARVSPIYANLVLNYLSKEGESLSDTVGIVFIKGFPYYFVTVLGLYRRKRLKQVIVNYDSYLLLSAIGSLMYLASMYSYWMTRAAAYFYFPIGIFFGLIVSQSHPVVVKFFGGVRASIESCVVYGSEFVILMRYMLLIFFINYHGI